MITRDDFGKMLLLAELKLNAFPEKNEEYYRLERAYENASVAFELCGGHIFKKSFKELSIALQGG